MEMERKARGRLLTGGCGREEAGVTVSLGVGALNVHESRAIIHHSSLSFTGYEPLKVWLLLKSNFSREPSLGLTSAVLLFSHSVVSDSW